MPKKNLIINLTLFLISFCFCLLVIELVFPRWLNKVPFKLYANLDRGIWPFAQSSKRAVIPRDYIALVGDSYAAGAGDWGKYELEHAGIYTPDYQSAHILFRKLGIDVVTFGVGGAGNLRGMMAEPILVHAYANSLLSLSLEKPKRILVYFYEGNDFYDNMMDFYRYLEKTKYDPKAKDQFFSAVFFQDTFIPQHVLAKHAYDTSGFSKNLIFSRFLWTGVKNVLESLVSKNKIPPLNLSSITKILVDGKEISLPNDLQAPPFFGNTNMTRQLRLEDGDIKKSVYVYEQALRYLAGYFQESKINVVYIPSPLSSYRITSALASDSAYMGEGALVKSDLIFPRSRESCHLIESATLAQNIEFMDATSFIRKTTLKEPVHGPEDWQHLNKKGQEVLSSAIITAFFDPEKSSNRYGCDVP